MGPCLLLTFLLLLSFPAPQVQGIRLQKDYFLGEKMHVGFTSLRSSSSSSSSSSNNSGKSLHQEKMQKGAAVVNNGDAVLKRRSMPSVAKKVHHWLPKIHEDYYGPRIHSPRHH